MATRKKTTAISKSKKPVAAAVETVDGPPEDNADSFARRVLEEINLVRANP